MSTSHWIEEALPESRQLNFIIIRDELKRYHCFEDEDGLLELEKIAQSVEEKARAGTTSEYDYSVNIFSMMQLMEDKFQEEVYQKIKTMKENYLPELNEVYQKIATKLQQHNSLPQQPNSDQLEKIEKLKVFKMMLERIIAFLQVSKSNISPHFKEKLGSYEKQIINFINANRPRKVMSSTVQTGQPSGGDWQEEVYQKIKSMKENYLPELNEMYEKIATKFQQYDSIPQQPKSDQLEKLKVFKMMLERIIAFLQVSKSNISPHFKEKLGSYEKQIINFINTNRPRKAMASMQPGKLPSPSMLSMSQLQSQVTPVQSHENQMNTPLQTPNMQLYVETIHQNNMTSMWHNYLFGVSTAQQSMMNSMQPGTNLDSGQGNSMNSLQQVPWSSLQKNSVSSPQQTNINCLSSQGGLNVIQPYLNPLGTGSSMLQHQ